VDLPMIDLNGDPLVENRVASIVAAPNRPAWVINQKEAGFVSIVDYADPLGANFPIVANIEGAKFLHDGGFDHTGNYFVVAANASNKMVVVDLVSESRVALIDVGPVPHPGRGVNWQDPVYGWVNATAHISAGQLTVYGADPAGRPDVAWQVVRTIPLPSAGSLFVKSLQPHRGAVDMPLSATGYESRSARRQVNWHAGTAASRSRRTAGPPTSSLNKTGSEIRGPTGTRTVLRDPRQQHARREAAHHWPANTDRQVQRL
jgi:nitrite reductase (NO-forming)/hydroxylamine reductase